MEQQKQKVIVFCLPGDSFSNNFLVSWSETLYWCLTNNIRPVLTQAKSNNIYYVRNQCLGGDLLKGENQKPFQGQLDYDYIMWIDSDQVFSPKQLEKLLQADKDIVSGLYLMENGKQFAAVEKWDTEYFKQHGQFKFLEPEDIKDKTELIEVDYTGFGFMLIKKGVTESLKYPWFKPIEYRFDNGVVDFCMEDVGFCNTIRDKGYKIFVDPQVIVGHEKKVIL